MGSQTASSGFTIQFQDIKSKTQEEPLNGNIVFAPHEETAEMHVLFGHGKGTLSLNGAVDAQEVFYNSIRPHSSIGWQTPDAFARSLSASHVA